MRFQRVGASAAELLALARRHASGAEVGVRFEKAPNFLTIILYYNTILLGYYTFALLHPRQTRSWWTVAPGLCEDTAPWPTPAFLETWRADAQPGTQPRQVGRLVRRQEARPRGCPSERSASTRPARRPRSSARPRHPRAQPRLVESAKIAVLRAAEGGLAGVARGAQPCHGCAPECTGAANAFR